MLILANTITADMGFVPGLGLISPLMGFPLSLIAAILERPFYQAAGIEQHTVWYSIRANVRSLLVGCLCLVLTPFSFAVGEIGILVWPFFAVSVSVFIEGRYLRRFLGPGRQLSGGWIIVANVFSAIACVLILVPVAFVESEANKRALRPYLVPLSVVMGTVCVTAIVLSFVVPARAKRRADIASIEVVSDGSAPHFDATARAVDSS